MEYKATSLIAQEMDAQNISYQVVSKGRVEEIDCGFPIDEGPVVHLLMLSRDDDMDVSFRVFSLIHDVPKDKHARILRVCNELNQRFRFVKFVLDDDDLDVEYDFPVEMSGACVGRAACEVFLRFVNILDESWPIIMKALFAGGESPQVDDDGAEENPLLDKIRNALVSEGVSLCGDETPQALMDKFRALRSRLSMEEDGESSPV